MVIEGLTYAATARGYARERLVEQIAADGSVPRELSRANLGHYHVQPAGLDGTGAALSSGDDDLWQHRTGEGQALMGALRWLAVHVDTLATPPHERFEAERIRPLPDDLVRHDFGWPASAAMQAGPKTLVFHPDWAIPPFWIWRRR